jgi:ATP-dependent DNA ligase
MDLSPKSLDFSSDEKAKDQGPKTKDQVGYALRFPRLIKFRDKDKRAEDATTVEELIEMYNLQGKK